MRRAVNVAAGFLASTALFHVLRGLGAPLHTALVVGAVVGVAPQTWNLVRGRRPDGIGAFFTVLPFVGLAVALVPGDPRFLLAKGALVTGLAGLWLLADTWIGHRPLVYVTSRALVEGRAGWPPDWEGRYACNPAFRRAWTLAGAAWGVGTLLDAGTRVVLAWTVDPDLVPALGTALSVLTLLGCNVVLTVVHVRAGTFGGPPRRGPAGLTTTGLTTGASPPTAPAPPPPRPGRGAGR